MRQTDRLGIIAFFGAFTFFMAVDAWSMDERFRLEWNYQQTQDALHHIIEETAGWNYENHRVQPPLDLGDSMNQPRPRVQERRYCDEYTACY